MPIRDHLETLAGRLASRGYDTAAFVSGYPLRVEAGRVSRPVRGIDLASTLLDLALGTGAGDGLRPEDESPALAVSTAMPFAVRHRDRGYELTRERPILGLRAVSAGGAWKLISYPCPEAPCVELYDLAADPGTLESEVRERLESLGYVGG